MKILNDTGTQRLISKINTINTNVKTLQNICMNHTDSRAFRFGVWQTDKNSDVTGMFLDWYPLDKNGNRGTWYIEMQITPNHISFCTYGNTKYAPSAFKTSNWNKVILQY